MCVSVKLHFFKIWHVPYNRTININQEIYTVRVNYNRFRQKQIYFHSNRQAPIIDFPEFTYLKINKMRNYILKINHDRSKSSILKYYFRNISHLLIALSHYSLARLEISQTSKQKGDILFPLLKLTPNAKQSILNYIRQNADTDIKTSIGMRF